MLPRNPSSHPEKTTSNADKKKLNKEIESPIRNYPKRKTQKVLTFEKLLTFSKLKKYLSKTMKTKDTIPFFTSMILALLGLLIFCMNLHSVLPYVLVAIPPTIFLVIIAYQDIKTRYIPPILSASLLFCGIPIAAFNWLAHAK